MEAIEAGFKAAKPGVTLIEVDKAVEDYILSHGCKPVFKGYNGYPATSCLSPNDVVVHGIPTSYALKDGDILTVDVGSEYDGWKVDSARTKLIRDYDTWFLSQDSEAERFANRLIFASEQILEAELSVIKNGCSSLDILKAAESASTQNFGSVANPSTRLNIYPQWGGHSIGRELHMPPFIPNCIDRSLSQIKQWQLEREYEKYRFSTGQVICLEPVVTFGETVTILDEDGWTVRSKDGSLVAHTEHCLLVTETGYEILS